MQALMQCMKILLQIPHLYVDMKWSQYVERSNKKCPQSSPSNKNKTNDTDHLLDLICIDYFSHLINVFICVFLRLDLTKKINCILYNELKFFIESWMKYLIESHSLSVLTILLLHQSLFTFGEINNFLALVLHDILDFLSVIEKHGQIYTG